MVEHEIRSRKGSSQLPVLEALGTWRGVVPLRGLRARTFNATGIRRRRPVPEAVGAAPGREGVRALASAPPSRELRPSSPPPPKDNAASSRSSYPITLAAVVCRGCAGLRRRCQSRTRFDIPTKERRQGNDERRTRRHRSDPRRGRHVFSFSDAGIRRAYHCKLQATKILIPDGRHRQGSNRDDHLATFQATGVDAGKVDHLSLASSTAAAPVRSRTGNAALGVAIDGGDFFVSGFARRGHSRRRRNTKINHLSWREFSINVPDKDTPASAPGECYKISIASVEGRATYNGELRSRVRANSKV